MTRKKSPSEQLKTSFKKITQSFSTRLRPNKNKQSKTAASHKTPAHTLTAGQHSLNNHDISSAAKKVLHKLNDAGYQGYLVGGGVRDNLLDLHPKDFDIATDATPEQLVDLFDRAMIIGRRFRIVHIRYGREVIEVTTFRGHHSSSNANNSTTKNDSSNTKRQSKSGMLLRDNVYGSMEEDAIRRDFTVNALYYDLQKDSIYDYTNGLTDLEKKQINIIGDPEQRYREDPVRMLRAVRLASKLDFSIADNTSTPIPNLKNLLKDVPAPRLFDEVLKLFMHGHAEKTLHSLQKFDLFSILFPATQRCLENEKNNKENSDGNNDYYQRFLQQALTNTDIRIRAGKPVTPAYLFAALLWPVFNERIQQLQEQQKCPPYQVFHPAAETVMEQLISRISLPRRFSTPMKEIWQLQYRLPRRHGSYATKVFEHKRFRAAYDFVLLRESVGEELDGLGQWWTDYQEVDGDERYNMVKALRPPRKPNNKKKGGSKSGAKGKNKDHQNNNGDQI